jgi:beta-lactamase class A
MQAPRINLQRFRIIRFSALVPVIAWNIILLFSTSLTAWTKSPLDQQIEALLMNFRGSVGIYAKDLNRNRIYQYHATEVFPTASVFKVPVMIELFRRVSRGEITLDERRRVASGISKHGGGALKYLNDAPELSLRDYCRLMIILSDNVATDTLMQIVNPESITSTMTRLGFRRTRVSGNLTTMHYRMYGISSTVASPEDDLVLQDRARAGKPLAAGLVDRSSNGNITTPKEMGTMFEKLYKGEIISPEASSQMVEILKQNTNRSMIPKYLPPNIVVAHKNGATEGVRADVGIVYLDQGPIVVSIFAYYKVEEQKAAGELVARIAQVIAGQ